MQEWDYQLELIYNSSARTQSSVEDQPDAIDDWDEWWEREGESGKSVLEAQHDDDDDIYLRFIFVYVSTY